MVKLIRLATTDNNAIFSNDFNENIIVPPHAKVALANLSMSPIVQKITIDGTNQQFTYKTAGNAGTENVTLTPGSYDTATMADLFQDIAYQMNRANQATTAVSIAIKYFCDELTHNRVTIGTVTHAVDLPVELFRLQGVSRVGDQPGPNMTIIPNDTPTNGVENTKYTFLPGHVWSKGAGIFRARFHAGLAAADAPANAAACGFRLALLNIDPSTLNGDPIPEANILCSIRGGHTTSQYKVKTALLSDERPATSGSPAAAVNVTSADSDDSDNDIMEICVRNGSGIHLRVYPANAATGKAIGTLPYPTHLINPGVNTVVQHDDLWPVIIFYGDGTHDNDRDGVDYVKCTLDDVIKEGAATNDEIMAGGIRMPPHRMNYMYVPDEEHQSLGAINTGLTIPRHVPRNHPIALNPALSRFLGFARPDMTMNGRDALFVAESAFSALTIADAFIVELLNVPLDSYDAVQAGRRSILKVVPVSDVSSATGVLYEASNLTYIDTKNAQPLNLRTIRARVLDTHLQPLTVSGQSSITILID